MINLLSICQARQEYMYIVHTVYCSINRHQTRRTLVQHFIQFLQENMEIYHPFSPFRQFPPGGISLKSRLCNPDLGNTELCISTIFFRVFQPTAFYTYYPLLESTRWDTNISVHRPKSLYLKGQCHQISFLCFLSHLFLCLQKTGENSFSILQG